MNTHGFAYHIIVVILRIVLLFALVGAGWSVYRTLSSDGPARVNSTGDAGESTLLIVLRRAPDSGGAVGDTTVEVYPVDVAAVQREFEQERRPGVRFDNFLARRMNGRSSIKTRLDERGQTTVMVTPGDWWIYATLNGAENWEWHLPVKVYRQQQVVDLTPENAYTRTRKF